MYSINDKCLKACKKRLKVWYSLESYVKLAKALGYSEEIMQLLSEPKYDTMEELLEINKNRTRKRGV